MPDEHEPVRGTANDRPVIVPVIAGPTASGKTALSFRLFDRHPGIEIVSADSRQIYIGMDVGTAKPSPERRRQVPHHLIDILTPDRAYSAGMFARDAAHAMEEIGERRGIPLVVGGTGFYLRALFEGLQAPEVDPAVYAGLEERMNAGGYPALLEELRRVDPAAAAMHPPENRVKTLRALACYHQTGVPYSTFLSSASSGGTRYVPHMLCLMPERRVLYDRINDRVLEMVDEGLIEETRRLMELGYGPESPGMKTVGYAEAMEHIAGRLTLEEMIAAIRQSTRRYAKRQITWFRNQFPDATFVADPESREVDEWWSRWLVS